MKYLLPFLSCIVFAASARGIVYFTNSVDADALVRSNAPMENYGGAGALSVSGSTSTNTLSGLTNGIADTFIRFNTASMVANFNTLFGTNNWSITGARLQVTEVGTPNNNIFDQGKGAFGLYWVADDYWIEGSGTPNSPTTDGIVYTNEPTLLTNTAGLGMFTNTAASVTLLFPLALPAVLTSDARAGGEVTLFLTATASQTGFTFNSRTFGTASARPFLEISAAPTPGITAVNLSGNNVAISATNGGAGVTCCILGSTNAALPLHQWAPVATNVLTANGNFTVTATNAAASMPQFFILQVQ